MSTKLDYQAAAPEILGPLYEWGKLLAKSGLEEKLRVLVTIRASQINRCAFCLALHVREGQALGDSTDRLFGAAAWREASWYSERERLALEWTEALTQISSEHPPADLLDRMKLQFTDRELVYLTTAVAAINSWNRFNVAFGTPPEYAEAVFQRLHPQAAPANA